MLCLEAAAAAAVVQTLKLSLICPSVVNLSSRGCVAWKGAKGRREAFLRAPLRRPFNFVINERKIPCNQTEPVPREPALPRPSGGDGGGLSFAARPEVAQEEGPSPAPARGREVDAARIFCPHRNRSQPVFETPIMLPP